MEPIHIRLDDRLVHAEVRYACVPAWEPDLVIISTALALAEAMGDEGLDGVPLTILPPEQVAVHLSKQSRVLILFGTPEDLVRAWTPAMAATVITLANRARREASHQISPTFFIDGDELAALRGLAAAGARFELQRVPAEQARPWDPDDDSRDEER